MDELLINSVMIEFWFNS